MVLLPVRARFETNGRPIGQNLEITRFSLVQIPDGRPLRVLIFSFLERAFVYQAVSIL